MPKGKQLSKVDIVMKDKIYNLANDDSVPLQVQLASLVKLKISRTFIDELSMYNYRVFIKECLEILYKKLFKVNVICLM